MASALIAAWMITVLATPEALGYADAARIAAQPILVLGMGLSAVLSPRAMEAAIARGKALANRTVAIHLGMVSLGGLAYLMIAGAPFPWNPMRILVPKAYEVSGLVAATILVNIVIAFLFIVTSELAAARRERLLALVSGLGGIAQIVTTLTAGVTESFARPLGLGASNAVRVSGYWYGRRQLYSGSSSAPSGTAGRGDNPGGIHSPAISEGNGNSGDSGR
jgi:O-antigen/teichoic acid export membrane protein